MASGDKSLAENPSALAVVVAIVLTAVLIRRRTPNGELDAPAKSKLNKEAEERLLAVQKQEKKGALIKATLDAFMYCTMSFALFALAFHLDAWFRPKEHFGLFALTWGLAICGGGITVASTFLAIATWDVVLGIGVKGLSGSRAWYYAIAAFLLCWICAGASVLAIFTPDTPAAASRCPKSLPEAAPFLAAQPAFVNRARLCQSRPSASSGRR